MLGQSTGVFAPEQNINQGTICESRGNEKENVEWVWPTESSGNSNEVLLAAGSVTTISERASL